MLSCRVGCEYRGLGSGCCCVGCTNSDRLSSVCFVDSKKVELLVCEENVNDIPNLIELKKLRVLSCRPLDYWGVFVSWNAITCC